MNCSRNTTKQNPGFFLPVTLLVLVVSFFAQSAAALAGALAQRNKQLQEAKAAVEQLQQQLAQQQEDAARQLEAAAAQHESEKVELQQGKQKHMRETLQLEVRWLAVGLLHQKLRT